MKRVLVLLGMSLFLLLLCQSMLAQASTLPPGVQVAPLTIAAEQTQTVEKIAPEVHAAMASLQPEEQVSVIVTLREQVNLRALPGRTRAERLQGVVRALQAQAEISQHALKPLLETWLVQGRVSQVTYLWIFNGLAVTATADVIHELAARPDVLRITLNAIIAGPDPPPVSGQVSLTLAAPNLGVINAPALWTLGFRGQGVVVANTDTGVSLNHPDLVAQWRGGTNSWYDPYGQHPITPTDTNGHGTWTMGVMVGRDTNGTAIGVAPDAQWIAVKIFDDQNKATTVAIHQGFQWLLDPDGNPATPDAPHVINNSWTLESPGCDLTFQADLQVLRAAGILPIFAAGNFGPNPLTSASPANYAEAFAVGATDNSDLVYPGSSRGPSACGEAPTIYPEVVAPGVDILTTDRSGLYASATGTSVAAPHVTGALALLLSAYPNLTAVQQEAALTNTVLDLGPVGPDNNYGHGRIDVLATYGQLLASRVYLPLILRWSSGRAISRFRP